MSPEIDNLVQQATTAQTEHRFTDARRDWTAAINLLRRQNSELDLARAMRSLGEVERKLHDGAAARARYEEAVALYRRTNDPLGFAHTLRHLGDVYYDAGEPQLAEPCYREALDVYRAHPEAEPLDVANAIRSMAVLKTRLGQRDDARQLWEQARELYSTAGVQAGVVESSAQLATLAAAASD